MTLVRCCQLAPTLGDLAANAELSLAAITAAAAAGADVIVLPELVTSGYVFTSPEELAQVAIPSTHVLFQAWARAAGSAVVVGGFAERAPDGRLFNSAVVVDATGVLAVYRKVHLWDREKRLFTPGADPPPVVRTRAGLLGVLVCYDLEFPEMTRYLALAGAELVTVPTNWPLVGRPDDERAAEVTIAMATARVNRVAIAFCDRSGVERGQAWTEVTGIVDAGGWLVASSGPGTATATAEVDLARSRDKALTPEADVFGDRRPDLYAAWAGPKIVR